MKTSSILLAAAMFAASGMAVAANQDAAKPAVSTAAAAPAKAATHHRHHKAHKANKAAAKATAKADPAK